MDSPHERLRESIGEIVVVDCASPYVVIGTLAEAAAAFLELDDADVHDFRDTDTNRELYVVKTARYGVQANRRKVIVRMAEVVAVSRLADVQAE